MEDYVDAESDIEDLGSEMSVYGMLGILGVGFYLGAYALLQFGIVRARSYVYILMNLLAPALVAASLLEEFNQASLMIQVSWIVISLVGLTRMLVRDLRMRFSAEELSFAAHVLPGLPRADMRRLLDLGRWSGGVNGEVLTSQGQPLRDLVYLSEGLAEVQRNGIKVAQIAPGEFIGEITYLTGGPATATVTLVAPSRLMRVPVDRFREFLKRNPTIQDSMERSLATDLRHKLNASATRVVSLQAEASA